MSEQPLQCEIVTPERLMFSQEADFVVVPASTGEMGIYPMHAPTICTIDKGCVKVTATGDGNVLRLAVSGGYVEVDGRQVTVLADRAMLVEELDLAEVDADIESLEQELAGLPEDDDSAFTVRDNLEWKKLLQKVALQAE